MKKEIKSINSKELIEFVHHWLNSKEKFSPFIHGRAGVGKTAIISKIAYSNNYELIILNLGNMEEGDLIGIPYREGEAMKYSIPEWLHTNKNKKCILFLDEIDRAPKNILNACLSLIREYRIHTHYIPDNWKLIAAGNSGIDDSFYDVQELDLALKSRFIHLFYELSALEFIEWAEKNDIHHFIINYLKVTPKALILEPENKEVFAYPNPRTWEILSNALKVMPASLWKHISIGTIGKEIGEAFYIFIKSIDKHDLPITFNDFMIDPQKTLLKFKKSNKNQIIDTVSNIGNNIDNIVKQHKSQKMIEIFGQIIGALISLEYFELSSLIFNSFESLREGTKYTKAIIQYMKNNPSLNNLLEIHRNKISTLTKY